MAIVYILYSEKLKKHYIGSCNDLQKRLGAHKTKKYKNSFTSKSSDWELFYFIEGLEYEQSRKIESHIKSMKSSVYIQNLKKYPEMVKELIIKYK